MKQLEVFVDNLTVRMETSNQIIKGLSLNMFEVISFYKELMDCWHKVSETGRMETTGDFDNQLVEIMSRAESLLHSVDFNTEHIDGVVAENDNLISRK